MNCAGCSCSILKKSDVDKWTSSITQMFVSDFGRQRFVQFLLDRSLNEAMLHVRFWEKCDMIHKKLQNEKGLRTAPRNEIIEALRDLVDFADENVNFSFNQMEALRQVLQERDSNKICDTLNKAKTSVAHLLDEEHKIFSDVLLKEYKNNCH